MRAGIEVLAGLPGRAWLVMGDMGELGVEAHACAGFSPKLDSWSSRLGEEGRPSVEMVATVMVWRSLEGLSDLGVADEHRLEGGG